MSVQLTPTALRRLNKLAEGGEAIIYDYKPDKVVKVFGSKANLNHKQAKVERLLKAKLPTEVVLPNDTLLMNGHFNGYVMAKVAGEAVHQLTKRKFLQINRLNNKAVLGLTLQISKVLDILHQHGVVVGDISDYNILFEPGKQLQPRFIDVDSWGIGGLSPDAFTEGFMPTEAYLKNGMQLNANTDLFGFGVLAFNLLSTIHPFNGTLKSSPNMTTMERIRHHASVLGTNKIIIPKMVPSWQWLSPDLQNAFLQIFEQDVRSSLVSVLEDQLQHSKYCRSHKLYYYDKYSDCPLCSRSARIIAVPVKATRHQIAISVIFEAADVELLLSTHHYLSRSGRIVHISSQRSELVCFGHKVEFSDDGQLAFVASQDAVQVIDDQGAQVGLVERAHGSDFKVIKQMLYYIDRSYQLCSIKFNPLGNQKSCLALAYRPLFGVSAKGDICVVSRYPGKLQVQINQHNFELVCPDKIQEYVITQDGLTGKWLFIYRLNNGKYRTVVFSKTAIEYDQDVLMYNATPLTNLYFYGGIIYDPGNSKIVGTNLTKNSAKEFACSVVDEASALRFDGHKFTIVAQDKIYRFG
ncbi:hypothetical protein FWF48_00365 [Candidatus Saccharibacteria bacterium]|nr:hypothetical protein [Candidatus Saccharibacteria bacterium]